jgi:hypothetical protein
MATPSRQKAGNCCLHISSDSATKLTPPTLPSTTRADDDTALVVCTDVIAAHGADRVARSGAAVLLPPVTRWHGASIKSGSRQSSLGWSVRLVPRSPMHGPKSSTPDGSEPSRSSRPPGHTCRFTRRCRSGGDGSAMHVIQRYPVELGNRRRDRLASWRRDLADRPNGDPCGQR